MSIVNEKRDIYATVAAYRSMGNEDTLPDITESIDSINNKSKDPSRFLVDLLVTLIGSTGLVEAMGELMTEFIRNAEDDLKVELKKQAVTYNSDTKLSNTSFKDGWDLGLSNIDPYGKLKTDPASSIGDLLYSTETDNFSRVAYNAIVADGGEVDYKGILKIKYNNSSDSLTLKPFDDNATIGGFMNEYIESLELINETEFTSDIVNLTYGTISSNQDKNLQDAVFEEKLRVKYEKLINELEDLSFSPTEESIIERNAEETNLGIDLFDIGCSFRVSTISVDQLGSLVNANTGNTNPYGVGINYVGLLDDSFEETDTPAETNKSTIIDNYFKKLINAILQNLIRVSGFTPETRCLAGLVDGFKNNGDIGIGNALDDIDANRNFFDCICKNAKSMISEYLFNLVKKELGKLVVIISKKVLKEKYDSYIRIIKSLFGKFGDVTELIT